VQIEGAAAVGVVDVVVGVIWILSGRRALDTVHWSAVAVPPTEMWNFRRSKKQKLQKIFVIIFEIRIHPFC
jgi:hypothetical protein